MVTSKLPRVVRLAAGILLILLSGTMFAIFESMNAGAQTATSAIMGFFIGFIGIGFVLHAIFVPHEGM